MKALYLFLAFSAGVAFQIWDAKYGAEYGFTWGKWTREHLFGLPPLNTETEDGRTDER